MKNKRWYIVLKEIYTPCAGSVEILLRINGKFTMGKSISYLML